MKKETKMAVVGTTASAAGAAALGSESVLWAIYSSGPGAALTGAAETNGFLAWLGHGSLATGGGGMAAGTLTLAILKRTGWGLVIAGLATTAIAVGRTIKRKNEEKRLNEKRSEESER